MKRRKFLNRAMSFPLLIAFHQQAQAYHQLNKIVKSTVPTSCRFPEMTLYTSKLEETHNFYATVLKFPIIEFDATQFSMQIGESILRFKAVKDGSNPFYHFAFNIPSNKHEKAKKWLSEKTPLLTYPGTDVDLFYFDFWDAHAMYFEDPSGNIGEFIARHTLDNDRDGAFGISDLLCISEIGTPVENPDDFGKALKKAYGLETYGEEMFVGDENGLFVVPPVGRLWYPENKIKARIHPSEIYVSDKGVDHLNYQDYPYQIKRKK